MRGSLLGALLEKSIVRVTIYHSSKSFDINQEPNSIELMGLSLLSIKIANLYVANFIGKSKRLHRNDRSLFSFLHSQLACADKSREELISFDV